MTSMSIEKLLVELNEAPGIRGSAMTTADGMVVSSSLQERFRDDVVSGLASFLVSTTRRAFEEAGRDGVVQRFIIHATHGKLVVVRIGDAYLVVITDQFARLEGVVGAVEDIATRIRRVASIGA